MVAGYVNLLIAMALTGVWLVFMRLASTGSSGVLVQCIHVAGSVIGVVCLFLPVLMLARSRGGAAVLGDRWYLAAAAGVVICIANVLMLRAFNAGVPVAVVGVVLNLGCLIPVLYGRFFMGERLVPHQWVGLALAVAAIVLLSWPASRSVTGPGTP